MLLRLKAEIDPLVNQILDKISPELIINGKVLDPSMGGGQFMREVERRKREAGLSLDKIKNTCYGYADGQLALNYAINKHGLVGTYKIGNFLEEDIDMRFDVIIGNPPFADDQNKKNNTGNYTSGSKKLHLDFINYAIKNADVVAMLAPVRGWWIGKNSNKNKDKFEKLGLKQVFDCGTPFKAFTGEIGCFIFDKSYGKISDEFKKELAPLQYSIINQFVMKSLVGNKSAGELKSLVQKTGKYRVILTSQNIGYTDDDQFFVDSTREKWRVAFNHNGNKKGNGIYGGSILIVEPKTYLSGSMSCFIVDNEITAKKLANYLHLPETKKLLEHVKVSNTNSKYHFSFIPPMKD